MREARWDSLGDEEEAEGGERRELGFGTTSHSSEPNREERERGGERGGGRGLGERGESEGGGREEG